jgi:3',5'-nucleoside bisphosphate phosphatase
MRIDLHTHSTASDGTDTPTELIEAAYAAGLDVVALTDHDTVAGHAEAIRAAKAIRATGATGAGHAPVPGRPFALVPGVELSCMVDHISLHLLGYLFDATNDELAHELDLLRTDRLRRARAMVDKLVQLGAPVSWEQVLRIAGDATVGRPHVALALVEAGVVDDVPGAFVPDWIGSGGRAYVEKYSLTPERGIQLVKAAGGVTVFAHPAASSRGAIVGREHIERFAAAGLDGLEIDHPDHDEPTRKQLRALASRLGLVVTGSSDYHGRVKATPIGAETTDPAAFEELVARATGGCPVRA